MENGSAKTVYIDELTTMEMVKKFNDEDKTVAAAVEKCLDKVAEALEYITLGMENGGRLFYIGSGTGGKIAYLDATECPPTFGVDDQLVNGIISGGIEALAGWKEETEDDELLAVNDLKARYFSSKDILVALSASGNTPYALAAVSYADKIGGRTIGVCCTPGGELEKAAHVCITADVGPEVIAGSTRLKAGTAQKMILNMLSSCTMIKLGKVYHNLMVDVRPINNKLKRRLIEIVKISTQSPEEEVVKALQACNGSAKTAILMLNLNLDANQAHELLQKHDGYLKNALRGGLPCER